MWPANRFFAWPVPTRQVDSRAVLKRMADRVQHVGLDPERVARLAGPDAGRLASVTVSPVDPCATTMPAAFGSTASAPVIRRSTKRCSPRVALVEGNTVGEVFDGIAVEVDLEFVHSFRVVAGDGNLAEIEWQTLITNTVPVSPRNT